MGMSAAHCQGNVMEFQCLESGHPEYRPGLYWSFDNWPY